jgi:rubrerythrin
MKKSLLLSLAISLIAGLQSFASADKTIENLKAAFKGESTASAKYAAYSEQARKEGLTAIAIMFAATSRAESIHAGNHKSVLEKMGQKPDVVKPEFAVKSTKENLQDAINGENYEMTTMYPGFIATAKAENANDAGKSFRWAMDTEKKHHMMYQNAIGAIEANKPTTLPSIYWVCPKCGNTYDTAKPESQCAFCSTKKEKFIKFDK